MNRKVTVRAARHSDRGAVLALLLAQLREHRVATPDAEIAAGVDGVLERPLRGRFLLARCGDEPVGLAALSFLWTFEHGGRAAWLDELYVVPGHRSAGIGRDLLRAACALAAACGAHAVDLEVEAEHGRAASLYAREGFRRHDRERWVKPLEPDPAAEVLPLALYTGGCFCGAVRYAASGAPLDVTHCHCRICRRVSGAPVVTWITFAAASLSFTAGTPAELRSSAHAWRQFCRDCGSPLTFREDARPRSVDVTVATLDAPEAVAPQSHTWTESQLSWARFDDDLPRHPAADPAERDVETTQG